MHHLLDMAQYTAFDKVYRNMIVDYTKYHMTPIKHDMSHALRRRSEQGPPQRAGRESVQKRRS